MANVEKDALSGRETTGHEWDGIKELNTPLPTWWLYVFYACIAFAVVWWVLYPSWPTLNDYWKGVLGYSSRANHAEDLKAQAAERSVWLDRLNESSMEEIAANDELRQFANAGGAYLFADNCAPCHGAAGAGTVGYPTLADDKWLWGGTLEDIQTTVTYGIRANHDETRLSDMPAFGTDGILPREEIRVVADYVLSLSGAEGGEATPQGEEIFANNCAACHGEQGEGMTFVGAPALNDQIWLYEGNRRSVMQQINKPKHGVMPAWVGRLSEAEIKQVTMYVHSLGGGQ